MFKILLDNYQKKSTIKLWNVKTRPEERWVIVACGNGTYKFINGYDNLCMDVQVYPYEGTADQKWKIQKT